MTLQLVEDNFMHQIIMRTGLLGALALAGVAHAAAPAPKTFDIKLHATIPALGGFEVTPVGWNLAEKQTLEWDADKKAFKPLTLQLKLKSGVGDVRVKFGNADEQHLTHETDTEAFYVLGAKVSDKDVGTEAVAVATKDEAKDGKDAALLITPGVASTKIKDAPLVGKYAGTLPLVFETVITE